MLHIRIVLLFLISLLSVLAWSQDDTEEQVKSDSFTEAQLKEEKIFLDFKQSFMEAIQQRAIENYNKALESLNACEKIYPQNVAMLYEKAKNYFSLEKYQEALQYCEKIGSVEPQNIWNQKLKKEIYIKLRNYPEALEIQKTLYQEDPYEAQDLLQIYFLMQDKENGLNILRQVERNAIYVENIKFYRNYFDPETKVEIDSQSDSEATLPVQTEVKTNDIQKVDFPAQLETLQQLHKDKNFTALLIQSSDVLDLNPTQPLVYWYKGLSQNALKKYKDAITTLENGLDFVFDDNELLLKLYEELIVANTGMGNTAKANQYKQLVQKLK
jgi:tetratricopeptide (TPR) repeat protein